MSEQPLLQVHNLKTYFYTEDGVMPSVDGVDFDLHEGETLAIVGESGCGKSVTSLSIMGLVQCPPGKIEAGEILYHGKDLLKISKKEMRSIRGNEISMIFQEPMTSLNPVFTVGRQIMESFIIHQKLNKKEARTKAIEMIRMVGIPDPEKVVDKYPHELSGGMRQRIMIAMALACKPRILIADEPTTALDVTIQAQIMQLLKDLKEKTGTSIIIITHDLGVVAQIAQTAMVMYAGQVVEYAPARSIYKDPLHPYTRGLLKSIPKLNEDARIVPGVTTERGLYNSMVAEAYELGCDSMLEMDVRGHKTRYGLPNCPPSDLPFGTEDGTSIMIDGGPSYKGYFSDIIRVGIIGKPTAEQERLYKIALEGHAIGMSKLRAGVLISDVVAAVDAYYEKAGVSDINQTKGWIGHSIGLNVHEYPCLEAGEDTPLQAGMVMSMEPSLTTPTAGTMCLEQNFIVTETGYELLSKMPTELVRVY